MDNTKKYKTAEEFVASERGRKIIDGKLGGEDIARANPDGTISVKPITLIERLSKANILTVKEGKNDTHN